MRTVSAVRIRGGDFHRPYDFMVDVLFDRHVGRPDGGHELEYSSVEPDEQQIALNNTGISILPR